jgi:hypothetical protein
MTDFAKLNLPGLNLPSLDLSAMTPKAPDFTSTLADVHRHLTPPNMAEYAVKAIYEEIADFEATLDADHEIGMPIVGGPAGLCVHVREVYRFGTDKLVFVGIDGDQRPVRLIQHLSQLNFLMLAAPKIGPVAVRIGFHAPAGEVVE